MRTEMRDHLESLLVEYRATRARMDSLAAEVSALTGEGRSSDRSVTATVGPQGQLVDLRIDQALLERALLHRASPDRVDASGLAARVLEASAAAAGQVGEALRSRLVESLPEHLQGLLSADCTFDLGKLLPPDLDDVRRALDGAR